MHISYKSSSQVVSDDTVTRCHAVMSLVEQARASGLDGLDFGLRPGHPAEALRQLIAIEILARLGGDWAQRRTGRRTNGTVGEGGLPARAVQGPMLLGFGAVCGEGVRESRRGRRRVCSRGVINRGCPDVSPESSLESDYAGRDADLGQFACPET